MKKIKQKKTISIKYPLEKLAPLKDILYFDIETTGLSPNNSQIYIIGFAYIDLETKVYTISKDFYYTFYIEQFFAESLIDEINILKEFIKFSKNFKVLLHFNGDTFDIPFILKSLKQYNIDEDLSALTSIDLYKNIRSHKKLLGLERLNQTSIEMFLGIQRKDIYSGGELIYIYHKYNKNPTPSDLDILLLHNFDDICGLISISSMLSYSDFFNLSLNNNFKYLNHKLDIANSINSVLKISFSSEIDLPQKISIKKDILSIYAYNNILEIDYSIYSGIAKYFFPNYKDYYYLPNEDAAIHKSIGIFVDKDSKQKAKKETAYIKKDSTYLMIYGDFGIPSFSKDYNDKLKYIELSELKFNDEVFMNYFLKNSLKYMLL